jgi:3-deoxy-7-phosphoheptulonate synthase
MIIVLKQGVSQEEEEQVRSILREEGCLIREMSTGDETVIGAVGKVSRDIRVFEQLSGVAKVMPVSRPYKLVSREMHPKDTVVQIGDVELGGPRIVVIAGPCAIENREQAMTIAREVKSAGAVLFRGGAFKPRTSPYSFQGLGEEGLKILAQIREETGLRIATEMTSPNQVDLMMKYVDVVQIGARNMQNFELLRSAGRIGKPVLLKRGLSATIEEWLMSAEYILSEGNEQVILCERGIRTFERYTRNTLDLSAIPIIKNLTHLPVVIDPSHATGLREKVSPMARAAIAAGADGLMIEVHHDPSKALSDGPQSLYPEQFEQLMRDLYVIAPVVGKQLDFGYLDKATAAPILPSSRIGSQRRAVFAGEMQAFAHKAALQFFGSGINIDSASSFRNVFKEVKEGNSDFGVIPLENSLTGSIHDCVSSMPLLAILRLSLRTLNGSFLILRLLNSVAISWKTKRAGNWSRLETRPQQCGGLKKKETLAMLPSQQEKRQISSSLAYSKKPLRPTPETTHALRSLQHIHSATAPEKNLPWSTPPATSPAPYLIP